MRYDTVATFIYDETSGKIGSQVSEPAREKIYCNLTELGAEKSQLVIGNLKDKTFILRTIVRYEKPITYVEVHQKKYTILKRINYDKTSSFYLTERKGQKANG